MRLILVTWHFGQYDKITLILYTNVYIFKVTFNQESWHMCHNMYVSWYDTAFSKDFQLFNISYFKAAYSVTTNIFRKKLFSF